MSLMVNLELKDMLDLFKIIPETYPFMNRDMAVFLTLSQCSSLKFNEETTLDYSINY
jgi:hypothetical protein